MRALDSFTVADFEKKYTCCKMDPLKVVIKISGLTGTEIWDVLLTKYKTIIEKVTKRAATITVHSHISKEDVDALIKAFEEIQERSKEQKIELTVHSKLLGASGGLIEEVDTDESILMG